MSEIIETQVSGAGPAPEGIDSGTNLLLPARASTARFAHFPEEVYDLSAESHLVRLLKVLIGDAGAGQLRKRLLQSRLQQSLQGINFYDLDRFYGALFGVRRTPAEALDVNPYTDTATNAVWAVQQAKDASYRSRITQFARGLTFGPTPTGIELVSEALLSVDTDVYETFVQADAGWQTYGEIEALSVGSIVETNLAVNPQGAAGAVDWGTAGDTAPADYTQTHGVATTQTLVSGVTTKVTRELTTAAVTTSSAITASITPATALADRWVAVGGVMEANWAATLSLSIGWYDGSDALISTSEAYEIVATPDTAYWLYATAQAPSTAVSFRPLYSVVSFGGTVGNTFSLTAALALIDRPFTITEDDYFDGETADTAEATYTWTGTIHTSTSTRTESGTTHGDLEDMLYSELEGSALGRISGNERREFVVRPKRPITPGEAYDLGKVLRKIKPADSRFVIEASGSAPYNHLPIRGLLSDSNYWEVVPKVIPKDVAGSPYTVQADHPVEQPRPPFSAYQGEAWSYIGDVIGVAAFSTSDMTSDTLTNATIPERVTLPDGTYLEYPAHRALMPRRHLLAGRSASDGILVAHPYWASSSRTQPDLAPLFTDRISLDALNRLLAHSPIDSFPQNPIERYWASAPRSQDDSTIEVVEISLAHPRKINYISVETAHFPHRLTVQVFVDSRWTTVASREIVDSNPAYLPPGLAVQGHPQHAHAGHWEKVSMHMHVHSETSSVRFMLERIEGRGPTSDGVTPVQYSLALRSLDIGFRVLDLHDVPEDAMDGTRAIGSTLDPVGSRMEFFLSQRSASTMLDAPDRTWKSEPQPVNYAVVSLYLDTRTASGDAQVFDTIYLEPTHSGAHLSIYWTEDLGDPTDVGWYESRTWQPIDRDYRLHKGYVHLPPTTARHLKLEFTALNAEPHGTFLPLTRTIRLFPQWLINLYATKGMASDESLPSGLRTAIEIGGDQRYADAIAVLRQEAIDSQQYMSTEALYTADVEAMVRLSNESWAFGFQPWHQGTEAPRFPLVGPHAYDTIEMQHTTQIGFVVGLKDIQILRTDPSEDDNSLLYDEYFHDFRQIEPGMTWTFNPGRLETVLSDDCVATSKTYFSRHNVWAVQFATQQTEPVQVIPDDDLRDPILATVNWANNPDGWHRIGDATIVYSPLNHSARLVRYSQPPQRAVDHTPGLVQEPLHEVFSFRPLVTDDSTQTAASFGGIESTLVGVSPTGTVYAAVRMTFITDLTSPMLLQVVDALTDEPLLTHTITGNAGDTIEQYYPFPLRGSEAVKVRLIQRGISDDIWEVDRLSLFDPGIKWEFSVDGGGTWVAAEGVRNNSNGVVNFPEPGNQLRWRVTGMRPRMSVSTLRIRPHYVGVQNARVNGVQRGPNVSAYDAGVPVAEDPLFTTWSGPIPREWFLAYRQFPTLVSAEGPTVTEFARFYGRPVLDEVAEPTDLSARTVTFSRAVGDLAWPTEQDAPFDVPVRTMAFTRSGAEAVPAVADSATALIIQASDWGPLNIPFHRP